MKLTKKFCASAVGIAALAIVGTAGVIALHSGKAFFAKADNPDPSFVITADDFTNAVNNKFTKAGVEFVFGGDTKVEGDVVTVNTFYTNHAEQSYSGNAKSGSDTRGDGFKSIAFANFSIGEGVGDVVYTFNAKHDKLVGRDITSTIDLTNGGAVLAENRVGFELVSNNRKVSFTSMTVTYACSDITPSVSIKTDSTSIGVGETAELETVTKDVFGESATFTWTSPSEAISITPNGDKATVEGVSATDAAVVTVTMTLNGHDYTDTVSIKVTETAADVIPLQVLSTTAWNGAGLYFDFSPESASMTNAGLKALPYVAESTNANTGKNPNSIGFEGSQTDAYTRSYIVWGGAPTNGLYTVTLTFKDNANNKHYVATAYFENSTFIGEANLTGNSAVYETETLDLTARINNGETFAALENVASSDANVATVSTLGNVIVVTGVAEGTATISANVRTAQGHVYSVSKEITVAHKESGLVDFGLSCLSVYGDFYGRIAYDKDPFAEQYNFSYYTVNGGAHQTFHVKDSFAGHDIYQMFLGSNADGDYEIIFYNTSDVAYGTGSFTWANS